MSLPEPITTLPISITIADSHGTIIEMNEKSIQTFERDGGAALIGKNLFDCHPEPARSELRAMFDHHNRNIYSIEKNGKNKLIVQLPWTSNDTFAGYVELSIELPEIIPHFIRS